MDGHLLVESEDMKETLLGVTIQSNLKWAGHIGQLQKKLKDRLSGLNHTRRYASFEFRKILSEGLFMSVLTYCISLWGGMTRDIFKNYKSYKTGLQR